MCIYTCQYNISSPTYLCKYYFVSIRSPALVIDIIQLVQVVVVSSYFKILLTSLKMDLVDATVTSIFVRCECVKAYDFIVSG